MTSQTRMEREENPSTETNSMMRISLWNTRSPSCCRWRTLERTPTEVNSSLLSCPAPGWTENTLSSEKSSRDKTSSKSYTQSPVRTDNPKKTLSFQTADNYDLIKLINIISMQKKEDHDFLYKSTNPLEKLFCAATLQSAKHPSSPGTLLLL